MKDGRYALIEFKLGRGGIDVGAKNLLKLSKIIDDNINKGNISIKRPSFLAVVTGTEYAYTRSDGVKVLPIGCLR